MKVVTETFLKFLNLFDNGTVIIVNNTQCKP